MVKTVDSTPNYSSTLLTKSIGRGKMIVEFFSALILVKVCNEITYYTKYRVF